MKQYDYKKILQYIIKDINAVCPNESFALIEYPVISAIVASKSQHSLTTKLVGLFCDDGRGYDCFLYGKSFKDFFMNIKNHLKNYSLSIVEDVELKARWEIKNRLNHMFQMPLTTLAVEADLMS